MTRWPRHIGRTACLCSIALSATWLTTSPAQAESLRCNGRSASLGDSRISVLRNCGEPVARDSFCAPVFVASTLQPVPQPFAGWVVPCVQVDEWQYDRGPGNLSATVRFQYGVVQSITYGQAPP